MRMQVILDCSFARPGSAPIWGGKKRESSGTGLIFDINKRFLKHISYLQSKEQSSLVIQSLVMSIDLHSCGKTSFYANLIKMLNYYNKPFNFNHDNLDDTKILHFEDHMQKKYITHWKHSLCN